MKQHQRWKVVSVSEILNVSVGKARTEDFSQKCFSVSGKTCFGACRIFGFKCSDVLTWVRSKRVKRSLIKVDVTRKGSLFRVRIVQSVCFGILSTTNKNSGVGFIRKFVFMRFIVFESSTPKSF